MLKDGNSPRKHKSEHEIINAGNSYHLYKQRNFRKGVGLSEDCGSENCDSKIEAWAMPTCWWNPGNLEVF